MNRFSYAARLAVILPMTAFTLVACGGDDSNEAASTTLVSAPAGNTVIVRGTARDADDEPQEGVTVGFRNVETAGSDCLTCGMVDAETASSGTYSLQLPPGRYTVACIALPNTCSAIDTSGEAIKFISVESTELTVDLTVGDIPRQPTITPRSPPATAVPRTTPPTRPPANVATFSGTVSTAGGRPAPGATVEFIAQPRCYSCSQPWVTADASGHYAINLSAGVYNATCLAEDSDMECGPEGGDGGPFPVEVPPGGQRLDFVVCSLDDYPACLRG